MWLNVRPGSNGVVFIVHQLQEKHITANKPLSIASVDLEEAFDFVPRDVVWWAMCKIIIWKAQGVPR